MQVQFDIFSISPESLQAKSLQCVVIYAHCLRLEWLKASQAPDDFLSLLILRMIRALISKIETPY